MSECSGCDIVTDKPPTPCRENSVSNHLNNNLSQLTTSNSVDIEGRKVISYKSNYLIHRQLTAVDTVMFVYTTSYYLLCRID